MLFNKRATGKKTRIPGSSIKKKINSGKKKKK
jgi:hypothetical protein